MKLNIILIFFSFGIILGCSKENTSEPIVITTDPSAVSYDSGISVQANIDAGVSLPVIVTNNNIDSLYGKKHEGGLIFYYNPTTNSGMVAPDTLYYAVCVWGDNCVTTGVTDTSFGAGKSNSQILLTKVSSFINSFETAVWSTETHTIAGYNDWYTPTIGELRLVDKNLIVPGYVTYPFYHFYTSSEVDSCNTWTFYSYSGSTSWVDKSAISGNASVYPLPIRNF